MGWTSLFFNVEGKKVFILGTGEVATRRANKFLDNGAHVTLVGNNLPPELLRRGAVLKTLKVSNSTNSSLNNVNKKMIKELVYVSDIIILATVDKQLSNYVSSISDDKLINRADNPEKGNIIVPTTFCIDDIKISLYTQGKSPLMAKELRKKIQNNIKQEDILEIKLQDYARHILKEKIINQKDRKNVLYNILNDDEIKILLNNHNLKEAKSKADLIINNKVNIIDN